MMSQANVSEQELRDKGELSTKFGEKLSWRYLSYVRKHPTFWTVPTHILYGENDDLTSFKMICEFANRAGATLTVMKTASIDLARRSKCGFRVNGYDAIAGSGARLVLEELFIQVHTVKFDSKSAAQAAFKFYAKTSIKFTARV